MKMHCEQRKVVTEVNLLVRKFSDSYHQALNRIKIHWGQRKAATEVN